MKTLQLGKFYPIGGGVEKVMYDLMLGLSERGVDCDMLAATVKGKGYVRQINEHARLIGCHTWFGAAATMIAPSMITTLRRICNEYDIIHVHHPDPMACLALFLSGYKGKVVVHWHSDILKQKIILKLYRPLQNWLLRRADKVVGTTPVYLAESPHLTKVQDKTAVLPIGIHHVQVDEERAKSLQAKYAGKKIVFSLGRLVTYKGFEYLIDAAKYLSDDYVVLIGGGGPLKEQLLARISDNNLQDKVKLLGRIPDEDLSAYYGACKLFCLSSIMKTEAFAIVQIEAMSCGKPIVATKIPQSGVSWVNANGVSGLNVEPCNGKALADAIQTVVDDEAGYAKYCSGALARFNEMFSYGEMISGAMEIYNSLFADKTK